MKRKETFRTHYDNLQVTENASPEVIKGAYKYLSQKWHPDKHPEDRLRAEQITKILNQAYETLSHPTKRRAHDAWIAMMRSKDDPIEAPIAAPENVVGKNVYGSGESKTGSTPSVRPWVRFWARQVDTVLFGMVLGAIVGLAYPGFHLISDVDILFGIFVVVGWMFVEPVFLSAFGTTPGKWYLKMKVVSGDKKARSYGAYLARAAKVWLRGLGLGIPGVVLITMVVAYIRLSANQVTSWDREGGFEVIHEKIGAVRVLGAVVGGVFIWVFLII